MAASECAYAASLDLTGTAGPLRWAGRGGAGLKQATPQLRRLNPKHTADQKFRAPGVFRSSAVGDSFADAEVRQSIKNGQG